MAHRHAQADSGPGCSATTSAAHGQQAWYLGFRRVRPITPVVQSDHLEARSYGRPYVFAHVVKISRYSDRLTHMRELSLPAKYLAKGMQFAYEDFAARPKHAKRLPEHKIKGIDMFKDECSDHLVGTLIQHWPWLANVMPDKADPRRTDAVPGDGKHPVRKIDPDHRTSSF